MLERLLELFSTKKPVEDHITDEGLRIATCVLLLEVAGADDEFSPAECERVIAALRSRFDLSQEEAERLILASQERRGEGGDLWRFTNHINQACSHDQKIAIIEEIWRVIYVDGTLDAHEDFMAHKLARLLNLTHPQLIQAKLRILQESREPKKR